MSPIRSFYNNFLRTVCGYEGILTAAAVVVHQYDFFEQVCRGPLDGRVDGAQQHR